MLVPEDGIAQPLGTRRRPDKDEERGCRKGLLALAGPDGDLFQPLATPHRGDAGVSEDPDVLLAADLMDQVVRH